MKKLAFEYIKITIGVFIVALGLTFFLVPAELAVGGVTGFAMVVNKFIPSIPLGANMFLMNIVLFVLAFIMIGPQFGAKTIYSSFALSGAIWFIEIFVKIQEPVVDDLILNLFYGILIQGIGMGIIFYQDASTGGTDIIAKIINKFTHIDIGKALLISDFLIVFMAAFAFGLELGLYALIGVIMNAFVIDNVIEGLNMKMKVSVVTLKSNEIKNYIVEELERGATIYSAEGGYTGETRPVITTVISRKELIKLKHYIKDVDNRAFVMVANVREVLGEGFSFDI